MNLTDLASLATVISSVAVLVSLVYLALQTRQNTRHMRAQIQQARNHQIIDGELLYATNAELRDLIARGDAADLTLTDGQIRAYMHYVSSQMMLAEDLFYQHREGLIDLERHTTTVWMLKSTKVPHRGFRAAWKVCRSGLGQEFQEFMEGLIAEAVARPEPDMHAVWQALLAAEHTSGIAVQDKSAP